MSDLTGDRSLAPAAPAGSALSDRTPVPYERHALFSAKEPPPRGFPQVSGYEILAELGRGGMGVVYQARDLSLQRLVALKMILAANLTSTERLVRFMLEAEMVARLQHPHIVQIYEVGQQDGVPYFALEYVDGGTLEATLRRTRLEPAQAARLIEQVARTVHHVHQHGIVHRDLKPANILLTRGTLVPKISDFGVAKQVNAELLLTETGAVIGTPGYMAPEQTCSAQAFGPAVDIHALGAILYELLAGRPPYRGATPAETMVQVLQAEPAPPRRWRRDVPHDLEVICLKCLEKEPSRRYASAAALADDLERFLHGRPIAARAATWWERTTKEAARRPQVAVLVLATAAALLLAAGSLGWAFVQGERRASAERALQAQVEARNQAERSANQFVGVLGGKLHGSPRSDVAASADGRWLAATDGSGTSVVVWDAAGQQPAWTAPALPWPIRTVALSRDGALVSAAASLHGSDGVIKVWQRAGGRELLSLPHQATALAFSPDAKQLAGVDHDELRLWDLNGNEAFAAAWPAAPYTALAFSPDGALLAAGNFATGAIRVWDRATGRQRHSVAGPLHLAGLAFSPDNRAVAANDWSGRIVVWNLDPLSPAD